ncbi:hypothetical protein CEXT_626121 [Caerostris extrusa]|uniref:Uncharacterized protein n=1 Tax=Caerostris extrusa TaxID=172846 RepID=A0AAV4Y8Z7_CAEEX|nr:hypothetical protein CEXT_626121 [Caerostris extrusa]
MAFEGWHSHIPSLFFFKLSRRIHSYKAIGPSLQGHGRFWEWHCFLEHSIKIGSETEREIKKTLAVSYEEFSKCGFKVILIKVDGRRGDFILTYSRKSYGGKVWRWRCFIDYTGDGSPDFVKGPPDDGPKHFATIQKPLF